MTRVNIGLTDWRLPVRGSDAIRLTADVGVDGIQLDLGGRNRAPWLDDPHTLKAAREALDETQVYPLAVTANVLNDIGLCAKSGTTASHDVRKIIIRAIDTAYKLGAELVFFPSFRRSEITNYSDLVRTAEVLNWACYQAEQRGLLLATENVLNPDNLLKLIRMVDSGNIRIVLDTANPLKVGQSPLSVIKVAANLIAPQVHIKSMAESAPLTYDEQVIMDVIKALNNEKCHFNAVVLENDYRDGVISRIKNDVCWLKKNAMTLSLQERRSGRTDFAERNEGELR